MEEVAPEVYRLGEDLEIISDKPLVLVHPWFNGGRSLLGTAEACYELYNGNGPYLRNLDALLDSSKSRNVFLFEQDHPPDTAGKMDYVGRSLRDLLDARGHLDGAFLVKTIMWSPEPYGNSSWEEVLDFMKLFSHEFALGGGYFRRNLKGCADMVYDELVYRGLGVELVEGCCFTPSNVFYQSTTPIVRKKVSFKIPQDILR